MKTRSARTIAWLSLGLVICAGIGGLGHNSLARVPGLKPVRAAVPSSYFGMTFHNLRAEPWPSIPFSSLRTWDTDVMWADIQQTEKSYDWSKLDALIALTQRKGIDIVYTLGRTPRWASASPDANSPYGPGQCAPPAKMEYWDEFVRAIVNHARGKIKFWEIWNEPQNPEFYCGSIKTMVELQRRAYKIIKAADPTAKVLTPSPVNALGPSWMSGFLAAGGGKYADIMAFHGYLDPGEESESVLFIIAKFKAVFELHGQGAKPIWDTEAGWGKDESLSDPDLQAAFIAKFYLLHWSTRVERFYWYAYDNSVWGTLWDGKGGLHKAGSAYREVHRWLLGATMTEPCTLSDALWKCDLARSKGYKAVVMWNSTNDPLAISWVTVSANYQQYRDLEGNVRKISDRRVPISIQPILVETGAAF